MKDKHDHYTLDMFDSPIYTRIKIPDTYPFAINVSRWGDEDKGGLIKRLQDKSFKTCIDIADEQVFYTNFNFIGVNSHGEIDCTDELSWFVYEEEGRVNEIIII